MKELGRIKDSDIQCNLYCALQNTSLQRTLLTTLDYDEGIAATVRSCLCYGGFPLLITVYNLVDDKIKPQLFKGLESWDPDKRTLNQLHDITNITIMIRLSLSRNQKISKLALDIIGEWELKSENVTEIIELGRNQLMFQTFIVSNSKNKQTIMPFILQIRKFTKDEEQLDMTVKKYGLELILEFWYYTLDESMKNDFFKYLNKNLNNETISQLSMITNYELLLSLINTNHKLLVPFCNKKLKELNCIILLLLFYYLILHIFK